MLVLLFILIPFLAGTGLLFTQNSAQAKIGSLFASLLLLGVAWYAMYLPSSHEQLNYSRVWLGSMNSSFSLMLDGVGKVTTLLTAISFPLIFLATWRNDYKDANQYYAFMLLTQAGLMGVFLSTDALLFYFFWELALIPTYFLCSKWGGEKRIAVSFKFFIYTFVGSVIMLIGIIYLYNSTPDHSFAWESFKKVSLKPYEQQWFFWFFFVAFAVKMPLFPLHTWQPDTYEQAPTGTTMVLSGVMVKMGLFGVVRWLIPVFPDMAKQMATPIIVLCAAGMIYASLIAIRQDDIKRLIAYSSIAHIGLMCAAFFVNNAYGTEGATMQLFNHGINIIGLWIVVDIIERQTGIRKMSELGGLAKQAPWMAAMLVVVALANIALPLTNAFVGEFLMFTGLFQYNPWLALLAGLSIILAAVYTLGMIQKVFYGEAAGTAVVSDLKTGEVLALMAIIAMIVMAGIYPAPLLKLGAAEAVNAASVLVKP
jgi:NADH-quinone oxidoreductase subunit M